MMGHYSVTDLFLGGLSIYWIARGFWVGLSGELFSLAGMVVGLLVAFQGGPALAGLILEQSWSPNVSQEILSVVCGFILFMVCNLLASIIGRAARKGLKAVNLGGLDRLMGAVAGCLKAMVLVIFLYGVIHLVTGETLPSWVRDSRLMNTAGLAWPMTSQKLVEWELLDLGKFPSYAGEGQP
jgi:membrane protein required for colicin V production